MQLVPVRTHLKSDSLSFTACGCLSCTLTTLAAVAPVAVSVAAVAVAAAAATAAAATVVAATSVAFGSWRPWPLVELASTSERALAIHRLPSLLVSVGKVDMMLSILFSFFSGYGAPWILGQIYGFSNESKVAVDKLCMQSHVTPHSLELCTAPVPFQTLAQLRQLATRCSLMAHTHGAH